MSSPGSTKPLIAITLVMASFSVALGCIEVTCRALGLGHPHLYQPDRERGWKLRPSVQTLWTQEGRAEIKTNSNGYRDHEWTIRPKPGVLRIAVLGDSFTEALQVPVDKTWVRLLPKALQHEAKCPITLKYPNGVETLNFGVGGYGTGQSWLTWQSDARAFHPQLVLHAIYFENDLRDNLQGSNGNNQAPTFKLLGDRIIISRDFLKTAEFQYRSSPLGHLGDWLLQHSRLAQLINQTKNRINQKAGQECRQSGCKFFPLGPDGTQLYSENEGTLKTAWPLARAILKTWNKQAKSEGSELVITSLTTPPQMWPDTKQRSQQSKLHHLNWFQPEQKLADILRAEQIPYLPLAPTLQRQADQSGLIAHGFIGQRPGPGYGHWNADGHRAASAAIAEELCKLK